jgi:hypothetical protein
LGTVPIFPASIPFPWGLPSSVTKVPPPPLAIRPDSGLGYLPALRENNIICIKGENEFIYNIGQNWKQNFSFCLHLAHSSVTLQKRRNKSQEVHMCSFNYEPQLPELTVFLLVQGSWGGRFQHGISCRYPDS